MMVEEKIFPQDEPEALPDEPETLPDDLEAWPDEPETRDPTTGSPAEVQTRSWRYFIAAMGVGLVVVALVVTFDYLTWSAPEPAAAVAAGPFTSVEGSVPVAAPLTAQTSPVPAEEAVSKPVAPVIQVSLPASYTLPVSFDDIGPQLLAAGAIDYDRFVQHYAEAGQPLTDQQLGILTKGSDELVVIDSENADFLLNFLWALGLTNANPLLSEGPMMQDGEEEAGNFASTGGWTLGVKPAMALYASTPILKLTPEQQTRLEKVAQAVYRPCCDNPTAFPDCNHGMAMLALLELMASQDATVDEMFTAAKYANAFWFPRQTLEVAALFKSTQGLDFDQVDAQGFVGVNFFSGTGFQTVHQWLAENKMLDQLPNSGNKCSI